MPVTLAAETAGPRAPGRSDPALLLGDPGRLREATGFAAEIPLERSLADLLDEWRAAPAGA